MNCQEFQSIVRDYSRGEWTSEGRQTSARQHLSVCPDCRLRLETECALNGVLRNLRVEAEAPAGVEQAVLAAFRSRKPARAPRWRVAAWVAIPVAAALLLAAVALRPGPKTEPEAARRQPAPVVEALPPEATAPDPPPVSVPSPPKVTYAKAPEATRSEFIPLRYGKPLESGEPVQVIRIALPRAELVRMGLPIAMDGGATTVRADVLLGEDGLAKAIRFVY